MIHSDWHIHSEYSYDAKNTLDEIAEGAQAQGLRLVGITDHANFNDEKFLGDLRNSATGVKDAQQKYPFMILGVELTPTATIVLPLIRSLASRISTGRFRV